MNVKKRKSLTRKDNFGGYIRGYFKARENWCQVRMKGFFIKRPKYVDLKFGQEIFKRTKTRKVFNSRLSNNF